MGGFGLPFFMVLGMRYGSSFNYAMAGLYRAAVAVSALIISLSVSAVYAADPPVPRSNVSVNVNPTTGYYTTTNSTLRLPDGVRVSPDTRVAPVVSKYPAGLQQTIPTGITIDAIKKSAPLPAVVRSTTSSLKGAATRCLTSAKCNVGLILAGEGLNRLFDGLDWVMGDGGKIQKKGEPPADVDTSKLHYAVIDYYNSKMGIGYTPKQACSNMVGRNRNGRKVTSIESYSDTSCSYWTGGYGYTDSIRKYGSACPVGSTFNGVNCDFESSPASASEIASGVDSSYVPEPSDWRALTPEMQPDDIEITSAPTLEGEPITKTVYDAEGNPHKVTQTNIWYDFDIRDNPSPRPSLDMKTREETKTYENGELTGTTTTESTTSGGSAGSPEPPPESPIDCDLFPTACAWFDWTQEEPVEPDDDLSGLLQEVPIVSETFTITGGVAACPAPMVLDLSVFGSREVSYQPLCDLASTMKYLYLALMSFAAAVLLNRSVNRV